MTTMKKVLFITHAGNPGGAEYKMISLCRAIGKTAEAMLFQHGHLETLLQEENIGFSVHPMPSRITNFHKENGLVKILKMVPPTLSMAGEVAREARHYDIVVCMSQKSFIIASLAKPLMKKPIVWFMNDLLSPEHFNKILILLLVVLSRITASHIVLNSQASYDAWIKSGGRRKNVNIIYSGIDGGKIDSDLRDKEEINRHKKAFSPDGKPLVGIFGRITSWKGQDVFLEAVAKVAGINAMIVGDCFFGEDKYLESLKDAVKSLGIESRVTFTGHRDDIEKLMAACDIAAHCSTAPEPFGRVIVEAMMCGTPVIAANAGGAREIVIDGETGQLTPPGEVQALAEAMQKYLDRPEWAAQMAKKAKARAKELFSEDALIEKSMKIIDNL
ncbi:MAG TPA: hypothetical protein DEA55_05810 [Rhodospirillaceae bacterium]|nr:hypothetical protein [Rhodospirillaceae bacterium]